VAHVVQMLARTVNEMRRGAIDVRIANGVTYSCATLLRGLTVVPQAVMP
jgi:hypothetical protein